MNRLTVFSGLYLIVASISPVMGYYILRFNFKGVINRLFFIITICLTFWSLGFSIIHATKVEEAVVFWTRISAIGYLTIYSVLLHFTLLITGNSKILERKWMYIFIYLPAAVCLYAFAISPDIAKEVYIFEYTTRGWIRNTAPIIFDHIFNIYYLSSVSISIILIWTSKKKSHSPEMIKQANYILSSFSAAFFIGTFTDIINTIYAIVELPQVAPILYLIPISTIFYCASKYHFMKPKGLYKNETILSERHRIIFFRITSLGMIAGGIVLFALQVFWWKINIDELVIIANIMLIILGFILHYVQRHQKVFEYLELMLSIASITVTSILTINMSHTGGQTVWAFPIMLIVYALVFNSDEMLLSASISIVISQIYLGAVMPYASTEIDYRTYVSRIFILMFIISAAYSVHHIYVKRLRENAAQTRTQILLSSIVEKFTLMDKESLYENTHDLLVELTEYFMADISVVHCSNRDYIDIMGDQSYCAYSGQVFPEHMQTILERWKIYEEANSKEESKLSLEKEILADQFEKIKESPWLFIPIFSKESRVGFIYIETFRDESWWKDEQLMALPVISRIVSNALEKLIYEMKIKFMAYYDNLTKLPNRQLFKDKCEHAISLAKKNNNLFCIIFVDLDSFKSINDTMGHDGGDLLIQEISIKLSDRIKESDTIARFGGDEFLILLENIMSIEDISKIADKIMSIFREALIIKGQEIFITASAGISIFPDDGEDAETLIKHADIAMYKAKEKGKNQYVFCSDSMKENVKYKVNLSNNLYRVLERNELRVYYQPQVDLHTERITGLEALVRWYHPEFGLVSPLEFIPLAEQTGLINPIGNWILETACTQLVRWQNMGLGDLRISVNISVVQLRNPYFVKQVENILFKTGINPTKLEIEITESTTTREPDYIIRVLNQLKDLGLSISIDDFGTEYSSLNRLKMLPVDRLKMDIQFVHGIDKSAKDRAITLVIMNLAKNLNLKLTAEGVESISQLDFLKHRMCDEVQGFYYYEPMPPCKIEKILMESIKNDNFYKEYAENGRILYDGAEKR